MTSYADSRDSQLKTLFNSVKEKVLYEQTSPACTVFMLHLTMKTLEYYEKGDRTLHYFTVCL